MNRIINPKYVLYMILPVTSIALGVLFLFCESIINYAVGGVLFALGAILGLCLFFLTPHSYIIDNDGIKAFYRIKRCNYIPWGNIRSINTRFDTFYDSLFFRKDYVIFHKNIKRNDREIDTVTKTKKTTALIEKYWWRGVDNIQFTKGTK